METKSEKPLDLRQEREGQSLFCFASLCFDSSYIYPVKRTAHMSGIKESQM